MISNLFLNMSIRNKILSLAGVVLGFLILVALASTYMLNQIGDQANELTSELIPFSGKVSIITAHQGEEFHNLEKVVRNSWLNDERADAIVRDSIAKFKMNNRIVDDELGKADEFLQQHIKLAIKRQLLQEAEGHKKMAELLDNLKKAHDEYALQAFKIIALAEARQYDENLMLLVEQSQEDLKKQGAEILREIAEEQAAIIAATLEYQRSAITNNIVISVIALVVGGLVALIISPLIVKPVRDSVNIAHRIAQGDLTVEIQRASADECGQLQLAMQEMVSTLRNIITKTHNSSEQLASAAEQLSAAMQQGNHSVQSQRTEIEQVATAINEMSATVHEVAKNASHAAEAAHKADDETNHGVNLVKTAVKEMESLVGGVEDASGVINKLQGESAKIGKVVDVIRSVAEQTNLLALNAAIEAARAGEQGRGFAVVADEVRTLAQRTQKSTREIEEMIQHLQAGAQEAVKVMQAGRQSAQTTMHKAKEAGQALDAIAQAVTTINDMNTHIASASEQQAAVSEEIGKNISNVNHIAEENAATVEQIAASTKTLAELASSLQNLVVKFKVS